MHAIRHARYSSSAENPLLHPAHAGTTGKFVGNGSSKKTFDGQWSFVPVGPQQKAQNAKVRTSP
jgi:hypothetical protein